MRNAPQKPERKPLPPSKPDYIIKSPTLLPPRHPSPVEARRQPTS